MSVINGAAAPRYDQPNLTVTGLAAPSRGATDTNVWRLAVPPGAPGVEHSVDREEIFVALSGRAEATIDGVVHEIRAGDALLVAAGLPFRLANPGAEPFEAIAVLPVGGRATVAGGEPFAPPWTV